MDYCRWCGRYTEILDLECDDCHSPSWEDRYHIDLTAPPGERWKPVVVVRPREDLL